MNPEQSSGSSKKFSKDLQQVSTRSRTNLNQKKESSTKLSFKDPEQPSTSQKQSIKLQEEYAQYFTDGLIDKQKVLALREKAIRNSRPTIRFEELQLTSTDESSKLPLKSLRYHANLRGEASTSLEQGSDYSLASKSSKEQSKNSKEPSKHSIEPTKSSEEVLEVPTRISLSPSLKAELWDENIGLMRRYTSLTSKVESPNDALLAGEKVNFPQKLLHKIFEENCISVADLPSIVTEGLLS